MKRNIIIAGVPRAGKTTLSRMLLQHGWTHISMDAIIAGFEQCYPETGMSTYQGLSSLETLRVISGKIAPFMRAMVESEYSGCETERAVFDVYQLLPEDYCQYLSSANCAVYWLGSSDCTATERYEILKTYDTDEDYSFYKTETELREGCESILEQSLLVKQQCEIYGLPFCDTTRNRKAVLGKILSDIVKEAQGTS